MLLHEPNILSYKIVASFMAFVFFCCTTTVIDLKYKISMIWYGTEVSCWNCKRMRIQEYSNNNNNKNSDNDDYKNSLNALCDVKSTTVGQ